MTQTATESNQAVKAEGQKPAVIEVKGISKTYFRGKEKLDVLRDLSLTVGEAEFVALMGPSGSGKTTLLNIIAGLDRPSSGSVRVAGADLVGMSDAALAGFRAQNVGFIFQTYNLLPVLTARENVELPLLLTKLAPAERRRRAETALKVVGLAERMDHYPRQLSGGQEQRVTIARAIVTDPRVIVADEPTGDLDRESADDILKLLRKLVSEFNKTIIMVTHDPAAAESAGTVHHLDKGKFK
ncbi:MAG: ABC transporter ATP-binding protein [Polyangiaceae bacterium]|nr:ABC transporter ATP-binding protein [Polyangiaceae bacterium]